LVQRPNSGTLAISSIFASLRSRMRTILCLARADS
jgi:hypothetical protein